MKYRYPHNHIRPELACSAFNGMHVMTIKSTLEAGLPAGKRICLIQFEESDCAEVLDAIAELRDALPDGRPAGYPNH